MIDLAIALALLLVLVVVLFAVVVSRKLAKRPAAGAPTVLRGIRGATTSRSFYWV